MDPFLPEAEWRGPTTRHPPPGPTICMGLLRLCLAVSLLFRCLLFPGLLLLWVSDSHSEPPGPTRASRSSQGGRGGQGAQRPRVGTLWPRCVWTQHWVDMACCAGRRAERGHRAEWPVTSHVDSLLLAGKPAEPGRHWGHGRLVCGLGTGAPYLPRPLLLGGGHDHVEGDKR